MRTTYQGNLRLSVTTRSSTYMDHVQKIIFWFLDIVERLFMGLCRSRSWGSVAAWIVCWRRRAPVVRLWIAGPEWSLVCRGTKWNWESTGKSATACIGSEQMKTVVFRMLLHLPSIRQIHRWFLRDLELDFSTSQISSSPADKTNGKLGRIEHNVNVQDRCTINVCFLPSFPE